MSFKPQTGVDVVNLKSPVIFPKYFSIKLDGIRAVAKDAREYTRSMKRIPSKFVQNLLSAPMLQDLDGELIVGEPNAEDVYSKTFSGVMKIEGEPQDLRYYVFDDLTDLTLPLKDRILRLQRRREYLPSWVHILEQRPVYSQEDLDIMYADVLDLGYEGLVGRNFGSLYHCGKSTPTSQDFLKVKPFKDSDAKILRLLEGMHNMNEAFTNELGRTARSSHQENKVGNGRADMFEVEDVRTKKVFRISAGKLNHQGRRDALQNPHEWVDSYCKYRHLPIGEKDVPRHGRWIARRAPEDIEELGAGQIERLYSEGLY